MNGADEATLRRVLTDVLESPSRKDFIKAVFAEAFLENMARLGIDARDPLAQQADMRHLRKWRTIMESGGMKAFFMLTGIVIAGAVSTFWTGFKALVSH